MARTGNDEWIFLEEPCDPGEGKRPARLYQPRSSESPRESYVEISSASDAELAVSDQIEKLGPGIDRHALQPFYQLLASLQTTQHNTFSSLLYWRNSGADDLQEPEVFCSDILIGLRESTGNDITALSAVERLAQYFRQRFQRAGIPTSRYRRSSIHIRLMVTEFGTKVDPKPLGYSLEIKILGGGDSKHDAVKQWAKAVELIKRTF